MVNMGDYVLGGRRLGGVHSCVAGRLSRRERLGDAGLPGAGLRRTVSCTS